MKRKYIYGSVAAIILAAASYQMGNFQAKEEMKEADNQALKEEQAA